jgi:hypothetical protein
MTLGVLYFSQSGNNRLLANALADRLGVAATPIVERHKRGWWTLLLDLANPSRRPQLLPLGLDLSKLDRLVLLAPVWNRHVANPALAAAAQLRALSLPCSFVTLCGARREGQEDVIRADLTASAGRAPQHVWQIFQTDLQSGQLDAKGKPALVATVEPRHLEQVAAQISEIVTTLQG